MPTNVVDDMKLSPIYNPDNQLLRVISDEHLYFINSITTKKQKIVCAYPLPKEPFKNRANQFC